jgi:hypothetical protein
MQSLQLFRSNPISISLPSLVMGCLVLLDVSPSVFAAEPLEIPPITQATDSPGASATNQSTVHAKLAPDCRAELQKLCQGSQAEEGRLGKCIQDKMDQLSPACRQQIQARKDRMRNVKQQFKAACEPDIKQFCPDVQRGQGRIMQCLKQHKKEVSAGCSQVLERGPKRK